MGYLGVTPPSPPPTPLEQLFKSHLNYAHKSAKIMPRREFTTPLTASTLTHTHSDRLRLRLRQRQRLVDRVRERASESEIQAETTFVGKVFRPGK